MNDVLIITFTNHIWKISEKKLRNTDVKICNNIQGEGYEICKN